MASTNHVKIIAQVIARAWKDDRYKQRFLAAPAQVLKEAGLEIPPDVRIQVVADSKQLKYIVLPVNPMDEGEDHGGLQCSHIFCSLAENEEA